MQSIFKIFGNVLTGYYRKEFSGVKTCLLKQDFVFKSRVLGIVYSTSKSCENTELISEKSSITPEEQKKRKIIEMEMDLLRQSGEFFVPEKLSEEDWVELLTKPTTSHRKRYYKYLKKREMSIEAKAIKSEEKRKLRLEKLKEQESNNHLRYGLGHNTIFHYIRDSFMVQFYNHNLAHSAIYGQNIIFDMDYYPFMNSHEMNDCVNQLKDCYGFNKIDKDPFHFHFCNVKQNELLTKKLLLAVPPLAKPKPLVTLTEEDYLNLFPREKLVYLTPDCRNDLVEYNHDDIYIIGCLVDRGPSKPLSLAKAKKQRLRMARLPLDRHLDWGLGQKSLTLDQVVKILLAVKNEGNWKTALRHVPKRKLRKNLIEQTFKNLRDCK